MGGQRRPPLQNCYVKQSGKSGFDCISISETFHCPLSTVNLSRLASRTNYNLPLFGEEKLITRISDVMIAQDNEGKESQKKAPAGEAGSRFLWELFFMADYAI
jgi:hypothetical protein